MGGSSSASSSNTESTYNSTNIGNYGDGFVMSETSGGVFTFNDVTGEVVEGIAENAISANSSLALNVVDVADTINQRSMDFVDVVAGGAVDLGREALRSGQQQSADIVGSLTNLAAAIKTGSTLDEKNQREITIMISIVAVAAVAVYAVRGQ